MLAFLVNFLMFSISFGDVDGGVQEESRVCGDYSFVGLFSKMFLVVWNGICISPGKAAYWISLIWSRVRINKDCRDELVLFGLYDYCWVLVCILLRERPIDAVFEYLVIGAIGILYLYTCRFLREGAALLDYLFVTILRELDEIQAGCRIWVQGRCWLTPWIPFRLPIFVMLWVLCTLALDWFIYGNVPCNEPPGYAVSIYLGHAEPLLPSYGSTRLNVIPGPLVGLGHGSCLGGVRLLLGWMGGLILLGMVSGGIPSLGASWPSMQYKRYRR